MTLGLPLYQPLMHVRERNPPAAFLVSTSRSSKCHGRAPWVGVGRWLIASAVSGGLPTGRMVSVGFPLVTFHL